MRNSRPADGDPSQSSQAERDKVRRYFMKPWKPALVSQFDKEVINKSGDPRPK